MPAAKEHLELSASDASLFSKPTESFLSRIILTALSHIFSTLTIAYPLQLASNIKFFIYLDGICSGDALLLLLVAENDERPTIFVERERSWKGAHCILVNWNAD